ncbi:MAG TPA: ABC transporter substrate-binding protein [Candidatus Hydrogenedens sp.]|nr:ABC transporter substrate-binding protein [Candidatus Hydrogenedens sp.]HOL21163.1 ABC transporter substrate-binding protein [Candidatus Hydrogenedens sp.]HPP59884.1 ABC transporter substrate-binding protein [Candidatus Hydrogenedens sp.]
MSFIFNLVNKIRKLTTLRPLNTLYYIFLSLLTIASLFSALAPHHTQTFISKGFLSLFSFRAQTLKFVYPMNEDIEIETLKLLKNNLLLNKKINIREIECDKNTSPVEMLSQGKGDITITTSVSYLRNRQNIATLVTAGEKLFNIISPKNYNITEFSQLTGKKIGFQGDIPLAIYLTEKLIQFYNFDVPPELKKIKIDNVEKAFSNGDIEAVVWVENIRSQGIRQLLSKPWYNIVLIAQINEFAKITPGIYTKEVVYSIETEKAINTINIPEFLIVSTKVPTSLVRAILDTWFSPEIISIVYNNHYDITNALPPPYVTIHPTAVNYLEKDKPLTKDELKALITSFCSILFFIVITKHIFTLWKKRKNRPYIIELEKRWDEISSLKYQWDIDSTNENILKQIKQCKSIYQWVVQSYKQRFISEKDAILIISNLLQQLIEFNERYLEYIEKKKQIEELSKEPPKLPEEKTEPKIIPDEKDKYLKQPPETITVKEDKKENQMLLFEPTIETEERNSQ